MSAPKFYNNIRKFLIKGVNGSDRIFVFIYDSDRLQSEKKETLESLASPDGVVFSTIKRPKLGGHSPHLHPTSPHHVTSPHHHHLHLHPHHLGPQHTPLGPPPPPPSAASPVLAPPPPPGPIQPPLSERVMLYVRQETDDVYTPLHVVPPSAAGLLNAVSTLVRAILECVCLSLRINKSAVCMFVSVCIVKAFYIPDTIAFIIENKYKISTSSISNLYRKNKKGILAKIDDDMLKYYCNEDSFLLDIKPAADGEDAFDITLTELMD
ncbi:hypothetical protein J437_LFUL005947 [Ladona fulva]|uniref:GRHL1/CP2 C-terminal domain-containing protein n=1 Tax=Ladona fulva TaxID=123851 RepID=A0A8K0K114_LADFU|nr:hypothetical protein J437_LFUL005947 [Ladona fulva]